MALFILDTDTLSLYHARHPRVTAAVNQHRLTDAVALTTTTVEEQINGALKRIRTPEETARATQFLADLVVLWASFDLYSMPEPATARFEAIVKLKLNIGRMDERIAAIALEAGATVVTRNRQDFGRVPGLTVVDWSV